MLTPLFSAPLISDFKYNESGAKSTKATTAPVSPARHKGGQEDGAQIQNSTPLEGDVGNETEHHVVRRDKMHPLILSRTHSNNMNLSEANVANLRSR